MSTIDNNNIKVNTTNYEPTLSKESKDILVKLKQINTGFIFRPDNSLVSKLKIMNPVELNVLLKSLFTEMVQENLLKEDPTKFLERLAATIPFEKLQKCVEGDITDVLEETKNMFEEAKYYLETTEGQTSPTLRARVSSILDVLTSIIESILNTFGIGDFLQPSEDSLHATFKSQKIMIIISLVGALVAMILPIIGAMTAGLLIGGTLLVIGGLSAIWPLIKPMPFRLPANAENWTKEIQSGNFVGQSRKESLDEIANILKMNRHAILVGPSRVGKSLTAKAFAQAIERGDYPELKGKTVFRINTSDLVGQKASFLGGGNNILNKISAAMGRHRDDIILVLDEIHMACKNNEKIAEQLKTFLDEKGEFPHVIGITTEEEYKFVEDNHAFSLRFDRVNIENTSEDETLKILGDHLLKSRSKPLIEEGALDHIYKKTSEDEENPQPNASIKILKKCINLTEKTQKSPTEKRIIEVTNEILSLRSQAAARRGRNKSAKDKIVELENQLKELQVTLSQEKNELEKLYKSKALLDQVTKETYLSVLKISNISQQKLNSKDTKQLKIFTLLHEFLSKSLETYIEEKSQSLGVKATIDEALIDQVA